MATTTASRIAEALRISTTDALEILTLSGIAASSGRDVVDETLATRIVNDWALRTKLTISADEIREALEGRVVGERIVRRLDRSALGLDGVFAMKVPAKSVQPNSASPLTAASSAAPSGSAVADPRQAIDEALELLRRALVPFVKTNLERVYGLGWPQAALGALHGLKAFKDTTVDELETDVLVAIQLVNSFWDGVFKTQFKDRTDRVARAYLEDLRFARNSKSHGKPQSLGDACRAADSVWRFQSLIGALNTEAGQLRKLLLTAWVQAGAE